MAVVMLEDGVVFTACHKSKLAGHSGHFPFEDGLMSHVSAFADWRACLGVRRARGGDVSLAQALHSRDAFGEC